MKSKSVPAGRRLDEQLQLIYQRVLSNGSMGVQALNFVASHFDIPFETVHRVCKKHHQQAMAVDPSFTLTFLQFSQIMREALGKAGGGDLEHGMVEHARGLARSFTIYDATCTTPGRVRMAMAAKLPKVSVRETEDNSWGVSDSDNGSRGRTPLDTGLATPRRLKTASFLPTTLNLTWSARRTGDSHIMFAPACNVASSRGSSFRDLNSLNSTWHSEYMDLGKFYGDDSTATCDLNTAGEYVPPSNFPVHKKFETEANEIGRASRRLATVQLHEPPVRHPAAPRGLFPFSRLSSRSLPPALESEPALSIFCWASSGGVQEPKHLHVSTSQHAVARL